MKQIFIGIILGAGILFLALFSFGILKRPNEEKLAQHISSYRDISWFIQLKGYPELLYREPSFLSAVTKPDRVLVYRVKDRGELKIGNYRLSSVTTLSESDAGFFSKVVCSPTSMKNLSQCGFTPGFAVQFDYEDKSFYALICYSCLDIRFYDAEGEGLGGWGMSREAEVILLSKFYELFPNDPEVQNLKL